MALLQRSAISLSHKLGTNSVSHHHVAVSVSASSNPCRALSGAESASSPKSLPGPSRRRRQGFLENLHIDINFNGGARRKMMTTPVVATPRSPLSPASLLEQRLRMSPKRSPKESLGAHWQHLHGSQNWQGLLDPLDPNLRRELLKYGEFCQATYDAFDYDAESQNFRGCRYAKHRLFQSVGLKSAGYQITKNVYATAMNAERSWIGFVAVSDDAETARLGRRDIVVAWRGTVTQSEWMENSRNSLHPIQQQHDNDPAASPAKVHRGFLSIYSSAAPEGGPSAAKQVVTEVQRLAALHRTRGEAVSVTLTGHSLGGALAAVAAHDLAQCTSDAMAGVPVAVFSFGAPRTGDAAFRDKLQWLGVRVLRVANRQDVVTMVPGILFNEASASALVPFPWSFVHVGTQLRLDFHRSPFLRRLPDPSNYHNLEAYLHLLDGFETSHGPYRSNARRDIWLLNKFADVLRRDLNVPPHWHRILSQRHSHPHDDDLPSPLLLNRSPSFRAV